MIRSLLFGDELKTTWESITTPSYPPFFTYAWHNFWWNTFHEPDWIPQYLVSDEPTGIIPFVQVGNNISFAGGEEIADYQDCLGIPSQIHILWRDVISYLKNQNIKTITLTNIPDSSPTLEFFRSNTQANIEQIDTTPFIKLPHTWEEHLLSLSRKDRHEIRRKIKKFELEQPGITLKIRENPTQEDIETLVTLMKNNPEKQQFFDRTHMETFFLGMLQHLTTPLSIAELKNGSLPVASLLAFTVSTEIMLYNSGFDEKKYPGAGLYLKTQHLKWAIESGYTRYNFLQGNERYKYDLGAKDLPVYKVTMNIE